MTVNYLLLGETSSGKSSKCMKMIEEAVFRGVRVGGVLSKPVFEKGRKVGNDLINLLTSESMPLCRIKAIADFNGFETENYIISGQAIDFGKMAVRASLGCGLIVIDEVGVLELKGGGLIDEVKLALDSGRDTLIVLKRKHKERFMQMFPERKFQLIEV